MSSPQDSSISLSPDRSGVTLTNTILSHTPLMNHSPTRPPVLYVGIDWADQKHDVHCQQADGRQYARVVEHTPEAIEAFLAELLEQAAGGGIAIALEKSRGPLVQAILGRDGFTLYLIDPKQFARYRQSFTSAGGKSDPRDAALLTRMLRERQSELTPVQLDDEATRRIAHLAQARRLLVDEATRLKLQLLALIKGYFPLLLQIGDGTSTVVLEILRRWPDPRDFRRAAPRTLAKVLRLDKKGYEEEQLLARVDALRQTPLLTSDAPFLEASCHRVTALTRQWQVVQQQIGELQQALDQAMARHPDAHLFQGVPGAGQALAPRLLAAFGSCRERFAGADEVAVIAGIAPITRQSGKSKVVVRRRACPAFLKQTFHEFADHARKWCPWSKAYYLHLRSKQMRHHAAVRKLASRWIRILYRVWKDRAPYDPARYLQRLQDTHHPLLAFLKTTPDQP